VLKPAHFLALAIHCVAVDDIGAAVLEMQQDVEKMQADARHQDRRNRHQGEYLA
jgi:uncharacterized protein YoxC